MSLTDSLKDLNHHASLLIGSEETRAELVSILEKKHKIEVRGNPDFFNLKYETFNIENARDLKEMAGTKPMSDDGRKVFILTMNGITVEAQNALLKLLEEPAEYVRFFLIVPSAHILLPTVKSRLSFIGGDSKPESDSELNAEAQEFVKAAPAKRLEMIKDLMDDISKEKKTKQDAIELLNAIESVLYEKGATGGMGAAAKEMRTSFEAIDTARKYLNDRAPSVKMLLEFVALNM